MECKRYQTASDLLLLTPLGALITIAVSTIFIPSPSSIATLENKAVIGPGEMEGETVTPVTTPRTNTSNVVLVHGSCYLQLIAEMENDLRPGRSI